MLHREEVLTGNITLIAGWLSLDRKVVREALTAIKDAGILSIACEEKGKAGTFYTITKAQPKPKQTPTEDQPPPDQDPSIPPPSPDHDPTVTRPSPNRHPDKSPINAGFSDSSLNKILPSEGEREGETERERERETARAPESSPSSPHPSAEPLCKLLADLIHSHGVKKPPVTIHWLDQMERILIQDKRDPLEVEQMIRWAQGDDFWRGNVLNPGKLRDHWDKMFFQQQRGKLEGKPPQKPAQGTTDDDLAGFLAMYEGGDP
jgi:hypothetical protein